jgi:alginate O-acetyltransferase complex protein AlgI
MLFSSGCFVFLFLPISLIGYELLSRLGGKTLLAWLALISLCFYAFWSPVYLLLLGGSILCNFFFSLQVGEMGRSEAARSRWLVAGIMANLLLLGWYKYLFPFLGFLMHRGLIHHNFGSVILPLGISFFTFTQIAYLIDLRQGLATTQNLLSYTVFVTFFPHLIAGPIIHPREIMPQLRTDRLSPLRWDNLTLGLSWFVMGLAKKVLIADQIAHSADQLYANPFSFDTAATWVGVLCYAAQLYFDFSGYSDMALGLARMFGIQFPFNFDSPYKASSIIDFWQRWHMTLSRYLGEYLFTPLLRTVTSRRLDAGKKINKKAQATIVGYFSMVFYPTMTTMFIAGIWHGAGLQYLIFGLLHGIYLVINHAWRIFSPKDNWLYRKQASPISVLITFLSVVVSLIFFRAHSTHQALYVLKSMAGLHHHAADGGIALRMPLLELALVYFIVWAMPNTQDILCQREHGTERLPSILTGFQWQPSFAWSLALTILFCASILMFDSSGSFLYFQF